MLKLSYSAFGQEWAQSYKKAEQYYNDNQMDLAFEQADLTIKKYQAESGETNDNYASILRLLSNICFAQNKFTVGLDFVQKEIKIREAKPDVVLATAYSNEANFLQQLGSYEVAITEVKKSLEILTKFYSAEEEAVISANLQLATNYYYADQNQEAFNLFTENLKNVNQETTETLTAKYYVALIYLELEKTGDAIALLKEIQKKYEEAKLTETPQFALVLKAIGEAYYHGENYEQAEVVFNKSQLLFESFDLQNEDEYLLGLKSRALNLESLEKYDEAEKLFDLLSKHPEGKLVFVSALSHRATIMQNKGDWQKAEKLYLQAMSSLDKSKQEALILFGETAANIASLYTEQRQYQKGEEWIAQAASIVQQAFGGNHWRMITIQNKRGLIFYRQNKITEAKNNYQNSLKLLSQLYKVPRPESTEALIGLAQCYQRESSYRKADSIYAIAQSNYDQNVLPSDKHYVATLTNAALSQQEQGNWTQARDLIAKVATYIKKSKGKEHSYYATALEDLAMLNMRLGNRQLAKTQLDSVALYYTSDKSKSQNYGSFLLSLGRYYQVVGEYPQAETKFRQGVELLRQYSGEETEGYAYALNSLALLYQTLGNFEEAEPLFKKSLLIWEKRTGKLNSEYATVLQNLASIYQVQENYTKAEPLLLEAHDIDEKIFGKKHPLYSVSLQNLATLYQKKKQFDKATAMMEEARSVTETRLGKLHPSYATVISNVAALYQDQANYVMAEKSWKESVTLRKQLFGEDHPDYARSLYGLAGVYFATGKLDEANNYFTQVVTKYQNQITNYFDALSEKEKSAFYNKIKPVFETYQDFCIQRLKQNPGDAVMMEKLYDLQLATKAILINASNKVRNAIVNGGDSELQALFNQWVASKENLVRYYSYSELDRSRMKIDLRKEEVASNDLEKKLTERSSAFSTLNQKNITWQQVKASLKENEAAVEIIRVRKKFSTDSVYYAALILHPSEAEPKLFIWPGGQIMEGRWFRYHRNSIKFHFNDTLSHKYFWQPLVKALPASHTLYLSCDGVFNKINFNAIQNPSNKQWVLDNYTIRLLSNTKELVETHHTTNIANAQASIFGYADFNLAETNKAVPGDKRAVKRFGFQGEEISMLPGTEKEAQLLRDVLKEKNWVVNTFLLKDATEANLKKIKNPQILHIATHGFFLNDLDINDEPDTDDHENILTKNPLFRSGILLAGAALRQEPGQEDGVLTAYEAMNLDLDQTELVSLSACETGLGEVRNGEGVYGLQRSLLVAGARTVIISLWQVDDTATQELMSTFYSLWLKGGDKFQSFRQAQLEIKTKYNLPYYWGAFVLIGNQ
jgi:CHAT domain-containing protein/Flp pilus assembly protein TadD